MIKNADNPSIFVTNINVNLADKLRGDLSNQGFEFSQPPHTIFSGKKKGLTCTLYQSGKLVVQGKELKSFIEFYLEPEILGGFTFSYPEINLNLEARIGIDESGKGDFFGPLCIAGVYAEGDTIKNLQKIGVLDSKKLSDQKVSKLAKDIKSNCVYHIVKINPPKYNNLQKEFGNLNYLLAWGHATTIEQLIEKTQCKNVIVDQFADESVVLRALARKKMEITLTQRHRAEEDLVVAAASVLARNTFLESLDQMEQQWGILFPKGASQLTIATAKNFVQKFGREALGQVAKLHFKTMEKI